MCSISDEIYLHFVLSLLLDFTSYYSHNMRRFSHSIAKDNVYKIRDLWNHCLRVTRVPFRRSSVFGDKYVVLAS
jgi:hypothetical protein